MDQQSKSDNPDAIQADIHRTRERLDETIEAVKDRLSPGELFNQVTNYFRHNGGSMNVGSKAGDWLSGLARTIKDNPIPVALIGIGLIGLIKDDKHDTRSLDRERQPDQPANEGEPSGAEAASEKVQELATEARESLERGYQKVRQRLEDDPIVLGALGIALGAALGAGLPRTRFEDEKLGEKRDELASKAKHVAEQVREGAKQVVGEAKHALMSDDGRSQHG